MSSINVKKLFEAEYNWQTPSGQSGCSGKVKIGFNINVSVSLNENGNFEIEVTYTRSNNSNENLLTPSTDAPDTSNMAYNSMFVSTLINSSIRPLHENVLNSNGVYYYKVGGQGADDSWTWQDRKNNIANIIYGKTWDEVKDLFIVATGIPVSNPNLQIKDEGIQQGTSRVYKQIITPDDIENGQIKINNIAIQAGLSGLGRDDDPRIGSSYVNGGTVTYLDTIATVEKIDVGINLNYLDYFPGEIKKDNLWYSHNRNAGWAKIKKDNMWRDVKNTLIPMSSVSANKGLIKKTNWQASELIGVGKNERYE